MGLKWRLLTASWREDRALQLDLIDAIRVANRKQIPVLLTGGGVDLEIRPGDTLDEAMKRLAFVMTILQE